MVGACADARLRVEFETEPAASRFTDLMQALPELRCLNHREVAGTAGDTRRSPSKSKVDRRPQWPISSTTRGCGTSVDYWTTA